MGSTNSSSRVRPIASTVNLAEQVCERLREAIESGVYPPGMRLVERRLSEDLNVSHVPIREALARLEREGLVERRPRRGCMVAELSEKSLDDISDLRIVLEGYVIERTLQNWRPSDEESFRRVVAQMHEAGEKGNTLRLFKLDVRFHELLWERSDNPPLQDIVAQLRSRINVFLRAANSSLDPEQLLHHADAHELLLNEILSGDLARAKEAMAEHIKEARDRIAENLTEQRTQI